ERGKIKTARNKQARQAMMMMMTGETKAPQNERTIGGGGLLCYSSGVDMAAPVGECQQGGDEPTQRHPAGSATNDLGSSGAAGGDRRSGSILRQDLNNNGS
ncbi:unnamed protein product, partial [Laminaria digitata]